MSGKASANKKDVVKPDDNIVRLGLFDRPLASGKVSEKFTFYNYLTFKNIVIGLGFLTVLIFLSITVSLRIVFLFLALVALLALAMLEMSSRRKWEIDLLGQLKRMSSDYDRLVREVARNRNDTASLRKKLSDAGGMLARSHDRSSGEVAEHRMVSDLAEQLSRLSDLSYEENAEDSVETSISDGIGKNAADENLTEDQVLQLVKAALQRDRIDLFLQPIVNLPHRKLRFYEMFSRIRIKFDRYLPAEQYIEVARRQDLMPIIDNLLLLRGLQVIRNTEDGQYNSAFFFNITSPTLNDPKFMGDLVEFISQNRTLAPRLIFEMGQQDLATMSADMLPIFDGLSKLGCRFSMDQVKSVVVDFDQLAARHIRFIKIEASLMMKELGEVEGLQRMKRLKVEFDRHGIDVIVEKIETERQILEVLEVDIDYGQGYLFGKPVLYNKN